MSARLPHMAGLAAGAAPIVKGKIVKNKTIATAIRIGNPASGRRQLMPAILRRRY